MSNAPVAIVSGAGSGVGRQVSRMLNGRGWAVVLVGRTASSLKETQESLDSPGSGQVHTCDVSKPAECRALVNSVGRVDALVNNAAMLQVCALKEVSDDALARTFATNTFGPANLIAACWPVFVSQGAGCVVNVSSRSTRDPFPGLGVYAASKAALESLTRSVHNEGRERGIRAFSVVPGAIETPMLRSFLSTDELPSENTLDPSQVASVIVSCITGEHDESCGGDIEIFSDM